MVHPARQKEHNDQQECEKNTSTDIRTCPECDSQNLRRGSNKAEISCKDCGLLLEEERIDHGPEWRAFNHQERQNKSRVGAPTTQTMHDKGLTTSIDWQDKDAHGRSLSADKRKQMNRLRKWQTRIRTSDAGERNLQLALSETDRMASALDIPHSVQEVASVIYRRALEKDLIQGRSIEGVATGTLYAACRMEGIPRSLEEVATVSRVERKEIARTYRYIANELGLKAAPVDPQQFVPRFCSELDLSPTVQAKASEIIDATAEQGILSGKSPTGYAAAAIYISTLLCDEKRTQREVANVAEVTEVTIRKRYQEQISVMSIHE